MATVKIKWRPSTVEGNAGTIYYRIIHNRVARQLKTDYKVFESEWSDVHGLTLNIRGARGSILSSIQARIAKDLKRFNEIIKRFDNRNRIYTADDVVAEFATRSQSFPDFMRSVILKLRSLNKHRTAENYTSTLSSFMNFRGDEDLLLSDIDADLMMHYEAYLIGRGLSKNTTSFYMRILRAVYNRAVEQELTEQRKPFRHVYTGVDKTVKRAISFSAVKRLKALDLLPQPTLDFARDMFLFSFYMRGMSFVDMAYLRKADLKHGMITYRRRKTGQQLTIKWEKYMQEIVAKYDNEIGSPYLLPIMKPPYDTHRSQYRNRLMQVNKSLKTIANKIGLEMPLTMYVARHSWASIARSKHIPVSVISEGMGHDSEATTQIYLASLDTAVIDRANRLILKGL